jgi:hypothetical protein
MAAIMSNLNLGDVESAESSTRLFANIVADKKRRIMEQADRRRSRTTWSSR